MRSHGSTWNGFPLRVGEPTLGDHLRELDVRCSLVGKTHMTPDLEGMARLGIEPESTIGALVSECGFDVFVRDDGTNATEYPKRHAEDYDQYLRDHGMDGDNPDDIRSNPFGSCIADPYTHKQRFLNDKRNHQKQ